jgi:hypothetical protein
MFVSREKALFSRIAAASLDQPGRCERKLKPRIISA